MDPATSDTNIDFSAVYSGDTRGTFVSRAQTSPFCVSSASWWLRVTAMSFPAAGAVPGIHRWALLRSDDPHPWW